MIPEKDGFLLLAAGFTGSPTEGDLGIIQSMNDHFSKKSVFFEIKNHHIVLNLHSLDLDSFEQQVRKAIIDAKKNRPGS